MIYPAHIKFNADGKKIYQTVAEHIENCALYASKRSVPNFASAVYIAGFLHDIGKYTATFKEYIEKAVEGEPVKRGSVNHTFAGVRFVMERWHTGSRSKQSLVCELIAFAIGAHHGLFDCIGENGKDGYSYRVEKEDINYEEAKCNFLSQNVNLDKLDLSFDIAQEELMTAIRQLQTYCHNETEVRFSFSMIARMLLSAVIDADRRDTAEFTHDFTFTLKEPTKDTWQTCLDTVEQKLFEFTQKAEIDKVRSEISNQCRLAAVYESGVYRLSVPTGGGKTLASLRYSLATALTHAKKRIIFVTPLLSVLEQNAAVIRDFIGNDSLILEHHSNVIREKKQSDTLDENELLFETWDAPIIITTLVQLLDTLFSGKTTCIRRMNALAESVIIIDEIQSVPRKMLSLFNMAINFLGTVCNTTIILCSATHPCLEIVKHPVHFKAPEELVPYNMDLYQVFRRTNIIDHRKQGGYSIDELTEFAVKCAQKEGNLLLVCNKKAETTALYQKLSKLTNMQVYHLSTSMCIQHRIDTLKTINYCLDNKKPVICVSTQLVEAGVDFSFACVIRVSAGMDNVIQAAGRCNRSGEYGRTCPVYIINIKQENLSNLKEIQQAQTAAEAVLEQFRQTPDVFGCDLSSKESINDYYKRLYRENAVDAQDYPLPKIDTTIFSLLSDNKDFWFHCDNKDKYTVVQAFCTAGENFRVFEDNSIDILVPYGKGVELIADLCSERAKHNFVYCKEKLEESKRFTISLYEHEIKKLWQKGGLKSIWDDAILVLNSTFYSSELGFCHEGNNFEFMGV